MKKIKSEEWSKIYIAKTEQLVADFNDVNSEALKGIIHSSINATFGCEKKLGELLDKLDQYPEIAEFATIDAFHEKQRHLDEIVKFFKIHPHEIPIEGSGIKIQDHPFVKKIEINCEAIDQNHQNNIKACKIGFEQLPQFLFEKIINPSIKRTNIDDVIEFVSFVIGLFPAGNYVSGLTSINNVINNDKKDIRLADQYILGNELYVLAITLWIKAVNLLLQTVDSLAIDSFKSIRSKG